VRRKLLLVVAGLAVAVVSLAPAARAQTPAMDTVVGSGDVFVAAGPPFGRFHLFGFDFNVTSGPAGENPTGQINRLTFGERPVQSFIGTLTCLAVSGNRAAIGAVGTLNGFPTSVVITVVDGGPPNSGADTFNAVTEIRPEPPPPNCSTPFFSNQRVVTNGDITVVDAPTFPSSKEQCKNGGWQSFGLFKNQGDCVSFVVTGGENLPGGK
jgi:hypothetical protein